MAATIRARRKAERPGEILTAAFEEFILHGYAATRLEDVAARAGVTKGTIYVYFENKEQVFEALSRERGRDLLQRIQSFLDDDREPTVQTLRADLMMLFRALGDDRDSRELLRLMISEAIRFPRLVDEHFQTFFVPVLDKLKEKVRRAIASGALRVAPALDYPELLLAPSLSIHIWTLLFADRRPLDVERYIETAVDLIMNGLLPSAPATPPSKD
jgi:AcrR family transcriptional regulator